MYIYIYIYIDDHWSQAQDSVPWTLKPETLSSKPLIAIVKVP